MASAPPTSDESNFHSDGGLKNLFWGMLFGLLFFVPFFGMAMSKFGGTVLKSSLSNEAQQELQDALHGEGSGQ